MDGEWVTYRTRHGWTQRGKVLDQRPDGVLIVGEHDNDPNPVRVEQDDVL